MIEERKKGSGGCRFQKFKFDSPVEEGLLLGISGKGVLGSRGEEKFSHLGYSEGTNSPREAATRFSWKGRGKSHERGL